MTQEPGRMLHRSKLTWAWGRSNKPQQAYRKYWWKTGDERRLTVDRCIMDTMPKEASRGSAWQLDQHAGNGSQPPRRPTPKKTSTTAGTSGATSYRIGLPTSKSERKRSAPPRLSSRRRPRLLRKRKSKPGPTPKRSAKPKAARSRASPLKRRPQRRPALQAQETPRKKLLS